MLLSQAQLLLGMLSEPCMTLASRGTRQRGAPQQGTCKVTETENKTRENACGPKNAAKPGLNNTSWTRMGTRPLRKAPDIQTRSEPYRSDPR